MTEVENAERRELWSMISVRICADDLTSMQIAEAMGRPSDHRSSDVYIRDVWYSVTEHLYTGIDRLSEMLPIISQELGEWRDRVLVEVHIAWYPLDPQDHLIFRSSLLSEMVRIGAFMKLDTWSE